MEEKKEPIVVPMLETERLILRPFREEDKDFVLEHFSKYEINEYSSFKDLETMEEAIELYERLFSPSANPDAFRLVMVLKETGAPIGTLGFHRYSKQDNRAELGYDMMKAYWGRGLMIEAVREIIRYGFMEMDLNRIEADANAKNVRSTKLMLNIGFKREGTLRQKFFYKGGFHDAEIFSILKEDWKRK